MISVKTKLTKMKNAQAGQIYVPTELMLDSAFPFKAPATVQIMIVEKCLIVEAAE